MRRTALTPVFQRDIRRGSIRPGAQIGDPPPTPPTDQTIAINPASFTHQTQPIVPFRMPAILTDGTNLTGMSEIIRLPSTDYVFTSSFSGDRVTSIDCSDRLNPTVADSITHANLDQASQMAISGNVLFVTGNGKLISIDISDPTNLSILHAFTITGSSGFFSGLTVIDPGTHALVVNSGSIFSINITNPSAMTLADTFSFFLPLGGGFGSVGGEITANGPNAALSYYRVINAGDDGYPGVAIIDGSDPTNLAILGSTYRSSPLLGSPGAGHALIIGSYFYQAVGVTDIAIYDISSDTSPSYVSTLAPAGANIGPPVADSALTGLLLTHATSTTRHAHYSVASPTSPTLISEPAYYSTVPSSFAKMAALDANYAATPAGTASLIIYHFED